VSAVRSLPVALERLTKWASVDVAAIRDNAAVLRARAGDRVQLMAMVKADGYGHGAVLASTAALRGGATWLGVSSPDEALRLRQEGITAPILVVGWTPPVRMAELIVAGVDITVWEPAQVEAAAVAAAGSRAAGGRAAGGPPGGGPAGGGPATVPPLGRLHLKVDTGMGRLGCPPPQLGELAEAVWRAGDLVRPVGVLTHFADAEADPEFTCRQDRLFREAAERLRRRWPGLLLHAANSAATLLHPGSRHDLIRCGIALYGYPPPGTGVAAKLGVPPAGAGASAERGGRLARPAAIAEGGTAAVAGLRPAMTFTARITQVKTVSAGESVGYGRTWVAERDTRIATVAAGYADGVHRAQSNRGVVLIGGRRCPIVGRVSMDQLTADVSAAGGARAGDEAVIFGRQGAEWLGADEVAAAVGTISYEVLCSVSARVPRVSAGSVEAQVEEDDAGP